MGAAGLKKIAQARVDIHTLLCMGEIAELCPASLEYRKQINNCRQKQRKQSIWFHKVVEIGTATNFIPDELLKKRAGENIIALMSTILPMLSEDDCDCLVLRLFEFLNIHADKTPGLGQLQCFRDAILSLAQQIDFKDRTCQYHVLLGGLQFQDQQPFSTSIPSVGVLAQAIVMLQKVVLDDDAKHVLIYRGWAGAAWVTAYARHVLGLPVCVLRTAQESVPINGSYQDAKVYLYVFEQETSCELVLDGKVSSLVTPTDSIEATIGVIDVENVNLRNIYIPDDPSLREDASVIVRSLALYFTAQRAASLGEDICSPLQYNPGLSRYAEYCLPYLSRRALKIVDIMGFREQTDIELDQYTWQAFLIERSECRHEQAYYLQPGPKWMHRLQTYDDCSSTSRYHGFDEKQQRLLKSMFSLADAASCLAFSNWGETLRLISLQFLQYGLPVGLAAYHWSKGEDSTGASSSVKRQSTWGDCGLREYAPLCFQINHPARYQITDLTDSIGHIVVGAGHPQGYSLKRYRSLHRVVAFDRQSVVFVRAAAMEDSISLDGRFILIYPGHITLLGQRRTVIETSNPSSSSSSSRCWIGVSDLEKRPRDATKKYYPYNGISDLSLKTMSTLSRFWIQIKRTITIDGSVMEWNCPSLANFEIHDLYVTHGCAHSYHSQAAEAPNSNIIVQTGFYLGQRPELPEVSQGQRIAQIFVQAVDQNPCGQWASIYDPYWQTQGMQIQARILQRNMCLQCVFDLIQKCQADNRLQKLPSCYVVIPGRLKWEDKGEAVSGESTEQSPLDTGTD